MSEILPTIDEQRVADDYPITRVRETAFSMTRVDMCLDWVVFPLLLFVQFGVTMHCRRKIGLENLDWKLVNAAILIFSIFAGLYRKVVRIHPRRSLILLLMPEIFTNGLLLMIMVGKLDLAFGVLTCLTAALIIFTATISIHLSIIRKRSTSPHDYQQLHGSGSKSMEESERCELLC